MAKSAYVSYPRAYTTGVNPRYRYRYPLARPGWSGLAFISQCVGLVTVLSVTLTGRLPFLAGPADGSPESPTSTTRDKGWECRPRSLVLRRGGQLVVPARRLRDCVGGAGQQAEGGHYQEVEHDAAPALPLPPHPGISQFSSLA